MGGGAQGHVHRSKELPKLLLRLLLVLLLPRLVAVTLRLAAPPPRRPSCSCSRFNSRPGPLAPSIVRVEEWPAWLGAIHEADGLCESVQGSQLPSRHPVKQLLPLVQDLHRSRERSAQHYASQSKAVMFEEQHLAWACMHGGGGGMWVLEGGARVRVCVCAHACVGGG